MSEHKPLLFRSPISPETHPGPHEISKSMRYGILAGVWIAAFISAIFQFQLNDHLQSVNMTLVPTMLPSISSEFKKSHQASWLGTAYLLATATMGRQEVQLFDKSLITLRRLNISKF
ncbi:hypothetical protein BDP27DRAFT_1367821 [Rhodocollybia butyracea]|uniref:Uncharacterized protein n=1 Tax=Rhodocollybia butyracea TaxID=206335 RepID=A0A9P5U280_9AGAR|nr:hypothetical protein BDP27DRAFT_1367821 [Rhodocollybia butyracea]